AGGLTDASRLATGRHRFIAREGRPGWWAVWRKPLADQLIDSLPAVDLHVIAPQHGGPPSDGEPQRTQADEVLGAQQRAGLRSPDVRVYLGYADGSGTTTVMLDEARRRRSRGTDVVVAAINPRSPATELAGLELLGGPDAPAAHDRLDVEALLSRNPEVAVVDELNGQDTEGRLRAESLQR